MRWRWEAGALWPQRHTCVLLFDLTPAKLHVQAVPLAEDRSIISDGGAWVELDRQRHAGFEMTGSGEEPDVERRVVVSTDGDVVGALEDVPARASSSTRRYDRCAWPS